MAYRMLHMLKYHFSSHMFKSNNIRTLKCMQGKERLIYKTKFHSPPSTQMHYKLPMQCSMQPPPTLLWYLSSINVTNCPRVRFSYHFCLTNALPLCTYVH
jgi:hypothetical protein